MCPIRVVILVPSQNGTSSGTIASMAITAKEATDVQGTDFRSSPADDQALSMLYERFRQPIHTYAYHLLGNVEDADDVTQEVFMRAWIAWEDLHDRNNLSAWLHCVAKNLSIDLLRRRKLISWSILAHHNSGNERFEVVIPDTGGIPGVAEREQIQLALANMPEGYAKALLLYAAREVPYYEIATIVGISPIAAATRISRAKGMFMKQYQRLGQENL